MSNSPTPELPPPTKKYKTAVDQPPVPTSNVDPEALSDALLSAGVDLKEEENIMSLSLNTSTTATGPGYNNFHTTQSQASQRSQVPVASHTPFLELAKLKQLLDAASVDFGLNTMEADTTSMIVLRLISVACEEYLKDILQTAVTLSAHRRKRPLAAPHSELSKALRQIAQRDKDREYQRIANKLTSGAGGEGGVNGEGDDPKANSEESQYKAANATALMMTSGKRKYSWMTKDSSSSSVAGASERTRPASDGIRFREAREEPGLVLRDLLGALEEQRMGVEKTLQKGYAKLRN